MTFISILIALLLERITPQILVYRHFRWLRDYAQWLIDVLHIEKLGQWMSFAILLVPLVIILWIFNGLFEKALFGLFELAFHVAVILFCLGPRDLDKQVDQYLDSIEIGEQQQRMDSAGQLMTTAPEEDLPAQVLQVCKSLLVEANIRIYAVLFWFVILGPLGALIYRLLDQWYRNDYLPSALNRIRSTSGMLAGWLDWIPARLTLFAYMISGSFEAGLQAYRQSRFTAIDSYQQNCKLLETVGFHSLSVASASTAAQAIEMVRKTRGLILRSLVVWLALIAFVSFVS